MYSSCIAVKYIPFPNRNPVVHMWTDTEIASIRPNANKINLIVQGIDITPEGECKTNEVTVLKQEDEPCMIVGMQSRINQS